MQQFITHFERVQSGVWECRSRADLQLPSGRVQVTPGTRFTLGTKFMGVDIARMLEEEHSRRRLSGDLEDSES